MAEATKPEASKRPAEKQAASKAAGTKRASMKAPPPAGDAGSASDGAATKAITIKKYANRRLYNTATSSYVTLDHLCQMVKDGVEFVVYDAKTGEDITRSVLTQIIVEEESKGHNLLPIGFLRQLISFYGDNLQMVVPGYLESSMSAFAQNQERMRSYMQEAFGGIYPFGSMEDMTKRNMAMIEQAMTMFKPIGGDAFTATPQTPESAAQASDRSKPAQSSARTEASGTAASETATPGDTATAVRQLQTQLETLQRQLLEIGTGTVSNRDTKQR